MANASAKKQAAANEKQIQVLNYGGLIATLLAAVLRLLLGRATRSGIMLSVAAALPMVFLTRFLVSAGSPKRDIRGELVSSGDDLHAGGLTEYATDVVYLTWLCLVLSALFGERAWYIYLLIPGFAVYKLWGFAAPMLGLAGIRLPSFGGQEPQQEAEEPAAPSSKRQEKLKKRLDRVIPACIVA
ncbi:DUF788-domain-containing protein [Auriculariales sp. MPI-PUGE-AT-0066]|nr:DUF788-domain-containing protein [Auriculariales sp. MPI-PUGE-AT-0066]